MWFEILKFGHLAGLVLLAGGLIGVFLADVRARDARTLAVFAEAVRNIALFYDGLVVPGALLLAASGTGLIILFHDGWDFLSEPWIVGMVALFLFEFIEGNTVTRLYFMRLRRLTRAALALGRFTPELVRARGEMVPTFTHFLDLPLVLVIVSLGVFRPDTWTQFIVGTTLAVALATVLTVVLPRLYPTQALIADPNAAGTPALQQI